MISHRSFSRLRFGLAVCVLLSSFASRAIAAPATGPRILSGTLLKSGTWQPRTAIDRDGNIYVTGLNLLEYGGFKVTVTKLDPTGQNVLYSVQLDAGWSSPIVIDAVGNAWVGTNATLYKLDPNGNVLLQRSQYALPIDLALGPHGDIYTTSVSQGCDPRYDADCTGSDVVVSKIDPNTGYSTADGWLGGHNMDQPAAIAVAADGRVFVTGYTYSDDLPLAPNAFMRTINSNNNPNGFFAVFDADLQVTYATYLVGTYNGQGWGVAAASDGSAYVAFEADASPLLPPGGGNIIMKFSAAGDVLAMQRVVGQVLDIAIDSTDHLLVTGAGYNVEAYMPTAKLIGTHPIAENAFVAKFASDLQSYDAVFYVATQIASGQSIAVDGDGHAVVAGYVYPDNGGEVVGGIRPANAPTYQGNETTFVSKLDVTIATGNTPAGPNVSVASSDPATSVTFAQVSGPGTTTLQPINPNALNLSLPGGFGISNSAIAYEIHTTAMVSAPIVVCLNASALSAQDLATATILHGLGGQWVAEPTTNAGGGQLCASVASLSPFAVGVRVDGAAPQIACQQADAIWHAANISVVCTATDAGVGLANAADAQFTLTTSVAPGTETANAATGTRQVCDRAGNCASAGPVEGHRIDMKAPAVSITSPSARAYLLNEAVTSQYACADAGSGTTCNGPVATGAPLKTAAVGSNTFTVSATDAAGNTSSASTTYAVGYAVKVLFDRYIPYKRGSVVPIVVQLADARGANVSAAPIALTNAKVNGRLAAQQFKFTPILGVYYLNLNTTGFAAGSYTLEFTAGADAGVHSVQFIVK